MNYLKTENFIADLHSTPWDGVDTSLTVNESWSCFKDTLVKISNKHAPTYTRRIRSNTLPWVTPQIRSLIVQRNFHHKKALKSGSDRDWSSYRDLRNRVTSSIREAKKLYYSKLIEENESDSSKLRSLGLSLELLLPDFAKHFLPLPPFHCQGASKLAPQQSSGYHQYLKNLCLSS